eukprot:TRINITY_DN6256_c0_g1_i3.p1 TRINITY_DN6256_c0_g1~~TRINITY_DN6256_c0_g1_i3.p1  ORF type:complete len:137 (-),score=33.04 TRINITY_DN6256_c0_g1_i3:77-487(-)
MPAFGSSTPRPTTTAAGSTPTRRPSPTNRVAVNTPTPSRQTTTSTTTTAARRPISTSSPYRSSSVPQRRQVTMSGGTTTTPQRQPQPTTPFAKSQSLGPDEPASRLSLIHISEPTRLLSISYAVFCLKKKKKNNLK